MRLLGFCSCRQLCALIQMCIPSLDETAVQPVPDVQSAPDVRPAKAVRHAESCVPCARQDNLQAAHHADSCVPCGELHALWTAVLLQTAVLPADSCACCRQMYALQAAGTQQRLLLAATLQGASTQVCLQSCSAGSSPSSFFPNKSDSAQKTGSGRLVWRSYLRSSLRSCSGCRSGWMVMSGREKQLSVSCFLLNPVLFLAARKALYLLSGSNTGAAGAVAWASTCNCSCDHTLSPIVRGISVQP